MTVQIFKDGNNVLHVRSSRPFLLFAFFLIMDFSEASFIKWFWPKLVYIKARKADASALEKKKMITGKRMNQSYHSVTTLATCLMAIFGQGLFYTVAAGVVCCTPTSLP